ncbi:PepSY-associated TM helix domain-containing protein [Maribacter sp. TH_r10]|uniref:PepSY-associated TM helix domain-containing protein n=1 Tax=Maribacter sp. TH_r10 TaxID=3082086 RepID=UPI002952F549|nr:PepSY-associated TM helix domain-containing protein [Maribacter sp. TH_r10]MDV7139629.1 PepSY-associated TM helix domain-containing protein [Maribacter sp. TH_r10]
MTKPNKRIKQARTLRIFRKIHRITGATLFIFFFFISVTGFLLGWKKHSNGMLIPDTYKGTSTNLKEWLPIDSLHTKAVLVLRDSVSTNISTEIDRIDIRKEKGSVKFVFTDHFWGVQLDGATGDVLHVDKRYSDFIENIHDGSILDKYFNTSGGLIKVIYTSIMGIALLLFTITGFWLWYGPKRMRRSKSRV